ncbi:exocyst subunit SEC5 ASCRUDRAFT_67911 [Ascoidea rubescens DSM 1968]|uniref:Exocyst complex component SEC5 n=1 Tax=Ascoidea rubescens DSM 1968 TaxID=1344418 RepID=A0A1D2VQH2_9ASCO|nr:hypothetical protein ASCRUDRAFT_67911 [Ascoidea rubescens DSM 1968]ODV63849.1 hypothetical protein ASCRUDRAFT_67911 [Ascoidea rubescens DSM 1968]
MEGSAASGASAVSAATETAQGPDDDTLLKFYQLSTLSPQSWDDSISADFSYSELDFRDVDKAAVLLKKLTDDQKSIQFLVADEPDPLGYYDSTIDILRQKNILATSSVDELNRINDIKQKFFISSKNFNTKLFLKTLHNNDSFNQLNNSLDYLESSIAKQSEELKYLVQKEFARFVKAKSSLDRVFEEFIHSGLSDSNNSNGLNDSNESLVQKNELQNLKDSLNLANAKASSIIKPIIDNKQKEQHIKAALKFVEQNKYLFDLPKTLLNYIESDDYESLIEDYKKGKDFISTSIYPTTPNSATINHFDTDVLLPDNFTISQAHSQRVLDRIWEEVEAIVDSYRKDTWDLLSKTNLNDNNYINLISKLLELGVEDNPITAWINSQYRSIYDEINEVFEKFIEKIILFQKTVLNTTNSTDVSFIQSVCTSNDADENDSKSNENKSSDRINNNNSSSLNHGLVDSTNVTEMWLVIKRLIDDMVVKQSNKIIQFWNQCELFLNRKLQSTLPRGYQNESEVHLHLQDYEISNIKRNTENLIKLLCSKLQAFFSSTQKDLNQILSKKYSLEVFKITDNLTPSSLTEYGFLPPFANSVGTLRYLNKFLISISVSFIKLGNLKINDSAKTLQNTHSNIVHYFVEAICATWFNDSSAFNVIEHHSLSISLSYYLNMDNLEENILSKNSFPDLIFNYEKIMISNIKNILYIKDHLSKKIEDFKKNSFINDNKSSEELDNVNLDSDIQILSYPSQRFLSLVHDMFLQSLKILLDSLLKRIKNGQLLKQNKESSKLLFSVDSHTATITDLVKLLTINNLLKLNNQIVPGTIKFYDEIFKSNFTGQSLDIWNILSSMENFVFESYCEEKKKKLSLVLAKGISNYNWSTETPPRSY